MTEVCDKRKPPPKVFAYRPQLRETHKQNLRTPGQKPRILGLFCCAGRSGVAYWQGFDVTGVDLRPQRSYLFSGSLLLAT
jgi:hypothetical protein